MYRLTTHPVASPRLLLLTQRDIYLDMYIYIDFDVQTNHSPRRLAPSPSPNPPTAPVTCGKKR